jgi:hypothetical protein
MTAKPILIVVVMLALCGCVAPQKIQQTEQDAARYRVQEGEKAAYDKCTAEAMPGTMEHFACRMSAEKNTGPAK